MRPAELADADALARIQLESWRFTYRGLLPDSFLSSMRHERLAGSFWRRLSTDEVDECIRVLEVGGRVGGFISFGPHQGDPTWLGYAGEVFMIYLLPELTGSGHGRVLLRRAFDELSRCRCHWVLVWVLAKNHTARRFYEREGMRLDGERRFDSFHERAVPVVRYAKALNPVFDFGALVPVERGPR